MGEVGERENERDDVGVTVGTTRSLCRPSDPDVRSPGNVTTDGDGPCEEGVNRHIE